MSRLQKERADDHTRFPPVLPVPPSPASATRVRGSLGELRSHGRHDSEVESRSLIGIDPQKTPSYCPPRLKAMGLVQHPPHSKSAVARKPTADLERGPRARQSNRSRKRSRFSAPLVPGPFRGPFFARTSPSAATPVVDRLPCRHGDACFPSRCRADHPLDHGRHRGLGLVSRDRGVASQPRPTPHARRPRLRGRFSGILAGDALGVAAGEVLAATPLRGRGSARRRWPHRPSRGRRVSRRRIARATPPPACPP